MGSESRGDRRTSFNLFRDGSEERIRYKNKSKEQLIDEIGNLWQRIAILETSEAAGSKAEKALSDSGATFRTFIEHLPRTVVYMAALDERSTTLYVSPQIKELLGYSQKEYGADPDLWAKRIHPDDSDRVMADLARCHETGKEFVSEYRIVRKDGQVVWFRDEATIVRDSKGDPLYLLGVNTDITDRKTAEEAVQKREAELRAQSRCLQEAHTALKFLLDRREEDKTDLEKSIQTNVKEFLLPYLEKLRGTRLDPHQSMLVNILESNIKDISTSFVTRMTSDYVNLTPSEIKVASLIKEGRTSKEIADLLNLSENTILFHRYNIRRKLGLKDRKTNLSSHLRSLDG